MNSNTHQLIIAERVRYLEQIALLRRKVDAIAIILDENKSLTVRKPNSYPYMVKTFLSANQGQHFTPSKIAHWIADSKGVQCDRSLHASIFITCKRLAKSGVLKEGTNAKKNRTFSML